MPTIPLHPQMLTTPAGREDAATILGAVMLWPDPADMMARVLWAMARRYGAQARAADARADESFAIKGRELLEFAENARADAYLKPIATKLYHRGAVAGRVIQHHLDLHGLAGFGFRISPGQIVARGRAETSAGVLGLAPMTLRAALSSAANDAQRDVPRIFDKRWEEFRPVCHLWAAHLALCAARPHRSTTMGSFPCTAPNVVTFLGAAEKIRHDAVGQPRFKSEGMWVLSPETLAFLKARIPVTPAA